MTRTTELAVAERISELLKSPATRHWVKTTMELALLRDPDEAAQDGRILARVLTDWCDGVLKASASMSEGTVGSIEQVLAKHGHSEWLRTALKLALHRDPVDAAADADALCELLALRASASGQANLDHAGAVRDEHGQMPLSLHSRGG